MRFTMTFWLQFEAPFLVSRILRKMPCVMVLQESSFYLSTLPEMQDKRHHIQAAEGGQ